MKRSKINCFILGFALMLGFIALGSCDDSDLVRRQDPHIDIQDEVVAGPASERQVIMLKSSYPWFAESSDSWIKLRRYRGQMLKPDSIVVEIEENPDMESREGWIEVRLMDQMKKRLPVLQKGRGTLVTLPKSTIYFNVLGGDMTIDVLTDLEWEPETTSKDGFTFTKVDKNKLKVSASKNTTGGDRQVKIKIASVDKTASADLLVVQLNVEKMLSIALSAEEKDMLIMKSGKESIQVPIAVNVLYEAVPSEEWIEVKSAPEGDPSMIQELVVTVAVSPNMTGIERDGFIVLRNKTDQNIADTLFVTQRGVSEIIYVKAGSNGDGSSWDRAFGTLPAGMAAASDYGDMEIWVASGDYQLTGNLVWRRINMFGGFAGHETKIKQRNLNNKPRILGGAFTSISAWGVAADRNVEYFMDGFIFTRSNGTSTYMGVLELYRNQGIRNCIVCDNTYGKNAGGYYDKCSIINCLFYNNVTTEAASTVHLTSATIINTTIVNSKGIATGGIRFAGSGNKAYNMVVWGNKKGNDMNNVYLDANGNTAFYNCAVEGGFSYNGGNKPSSTSGCITLGSDNMGASGPNFVDPVNRDYSLLGNSPCIDNGFNDIINTAKITFDIIGNARRSGASVDMGSYEYQK
ncbi:MAG: choice-of-anchor Q domain-containing protein [Bacteroidales bacterium]